jgi:hypothetical protein
MSNPAVEVPGGAHDSRRSTWIKGVLIILVVTIPAFLLGPVIWPPLGIEPTPGQIPFFMVVSLFEALALGLGVTFLLLGLPVVRRVAPDLQLRAWLLYLSIGWALISWWPHGRLNASNGDNMQRLLYIEYAFHVTLVISAAIAAYSFASLMRVLARRQEEAVRTR